jgi:hypothetical protein
MDDIPGYAAVTVTVVLINAQADRANCIKRTRLGEGGPRVGILRFEQRFFPSGFRLIVSRRVLVRRR